MESAEAPAQMQSAEAPAQMQSAEAPAQMQSAGAPAQMQSADAPAQMQSAGAPAQISAEAPAQMNRPEMATPEYIEQQIKLGVEEYLSRTSIIKVPPRLVVPLYELRVPETVSSISQNLVADRLKARRQATAIPYKDLYSSDRRRNGRQVPESATYTDAKAALMTSNSLPVTSLAVGLETRELWMMSSLRPPGINGLI